MNVCIGARTLVSLTARTGERVRNIYARSGSRAPIPTGLSLSAQGCRACEATLGYRFQRILQPQRRCVKSTRHRHNPVGVDVYFNATPRVACASQPWAERHYPFGVNQRCTDLSKESRTLAALRDALLPKLLSGELRLPSQGFGSARRRHYYQPNPQPTESTS